jgi:ABC-type methionine transport system ATPase subunit
MASGTAVYRLTFTREMANAPILQKIGKQFRLTLVIRRAMLSEAAGWAEVALTGTIEEIGRAIAELQTTGVSVTGPLATEEVVEPDDEPVLATVARGT